MHTERMRAGKISAATTYGATECPKDQPKAYA